MAEDIIPIAQELDDRFQSLGERIKELPAPYINHVAPDYIGLVKAANQYFHEAKIVMDNLHLNVQYLIFDLEATRRERDDC